MRILVTFSGGLGHLEPLVPIATAARERGHEVAMAGRPWMVPRVEAMGFTVFPAGSDAGLTPERRPLLQVDLEREAMDLRDGFAGRIARERAADLVGICERWRPDVVVWDETDFGAPVVAERLGIVHASVITLVAGTFVVPPRFGPQPFRPVAFAPVLDALREAHGLPPDPELRMLERHLVLAPLPPSFRDPAQPLPAVTRFVRPTLRAGDQPVPAWLDELGRDGRPLVYFTLGTVFHVESGDLFERAVAGLRELPVDVLVTVGNEIDPAELGPQPANVRIERFVPQAHVLPRAAVVVSHGGSGSVIGALVHGRPMVLIAMGADQPLNARRAEALGLGRVLDPVSVTPAQVRDAVAGLLADPAAHRAAAALRDEIAALPPPAAAIPWLEDLVPAIRR